MAISLITTGEQTVTATGAVTGSLSTTGLTAGVGAIKVRITGLTSGQTIRLALEDTANVTPFSEALQVWSVDSAQGQTPDGNTFSVKTIDLPDMRFGATNNKLRFNCQAITGSTSVKVIGWLEQ